MTQSGGRSVFPRTITKAASSPLLGCSILVLVTFLTYWPATNAGFIWDDDFYLTDNPIIKMADGVRRFWFSTEPEEYYPLTYTTWWLEWRLWGTDARGYHVLNVVLHTLNALLVWAVLRGLSVPAAWLAALIFAVHPVNVASVAWIAERKNTLSMMFYLLAILAWLRFEHRPRARWYAATLLAYILALFSKTAVVMLPFVLLGCSWWRTGTISRAAVMRSVPLFALGLVFGMVTIWFQYNRALSGRIVREAGILARLAEAGWSIWFYLKKALVPFELSMIYPRWEITQWGWLAYVPGLLLIVTFLLFWRYRFTWGKHALMAMGYFVVTLFPVLGFFDQGFYEHSLVADHWQYSSILGPIALTVAGIRWWLRGWQLHWKALLAAAVVVGLSIESWHGCHIFRSQESLWRDTLAKNPGAWVAHNNLGVALRQRGELAEALRLFENALRLRPNHADTHNNLGIVLDLMGRTDEAIVHFTRALELRPRFAQAHNNLGLIYLRTNRIPEAASHFSAALEVKPHDPLSLNNMGAVMTNQGRDREAVDYFRRALIMKPDFEDAHSNLAAALARLGMHSEAILHYSEALRIRPHDPECHNNLGVELAIEGQPTKAMVHFQEALRLRPDFRQAHENLERARSQERATKAP